MLVLSRKKNGIIRIGENVTIVVVEIRHDKVRIGVDAPKGVIVDREEVAVARHRTGWFEKQAAAYAWDPCLHGA